MVWGGLKKMISQKQLNALLNKRQVRGVSKTIERIGIVITIKNDKNINHFKGLCEDLNIQSNNIKIIVFSDKHKKELDGLENYFNPKDFSWNGKIKNPELRSFLDSNFDVLISYYEKNNIELKLITAYSKAKFKVGILQTDERLNDLIIRTQENDFQVFKNELIKYLTILTK